jgi:hypothetical protein
MLSLFDSATLEERFPRMGTWRPEIAYDIHSDPILPVELAWRPTPAQTAEPAKQP